MVVRMVARMVLRMGFGSDVSAPAVDLLNENPSLVAFGNQLSPPTPPGISSKALTGTFSGPLKPVPAHQDKQILLCGCVRMAVRMAVWMLYGWLAGRTSRTRL